MTPRHHRRRRWGLERTGADTDRDDDGPPSLARRGRPGRPVSSDATGAARRRPRGQFERRTDRRDRPPVRPAAAGRRSSAPPYGTERCYNAPRLAHALLKRDPGAGVTVFLMADAVGAARRGQRTPEGHYSPGRTLKRVMAGKGQVLLCGACMGARGMTDDDLAEGARRSTMDELAAATAAADKVLVF